MEMKQDGLEPKMQNVVQRLGLTSGGPAALHRHSAGTPLAAETVRAIFHLDRCSWPREADLMGRPANRSRRSCADPSLLLNAR